MSKQKIEKVTLREVSIALLADRLRSVISISCSSIFGFVLHSDESIMLLLTSNNSMITAGWRMRYCLVRTILSCKP